MALRSSSAGARGPWARLFWPAARPSRRPPPSSPRRAISSDQLVGKWGFAAYHRDTDRARTIKEAKAQCNKPYVIAKGPSGGVMMNLADQARLSELVLKAGPDGATYLGPPGDAGTADDRIVSNVDPNSFTTVWVDPDNASRYGTIGVRALRRRRREAPCHSPSPRSRHER